MAHCVESMAFVKAPWHGLGNRLPPAQPLEVWQTAAGMDWEIQESEVLYETHATSAGDLAVHRHPEAKVLFRSDSLQPLAVVSPRYKVVQPKEILAFYRDLVQVGGFALETAGVLKGGRKFWALARTGQEIRLRGQDQVKGYLLLATSADGTLSTTAQFTSVRVVCHNTLQLALRDQSGAVKVPHSTHFDPFRVKQALGLGEALWEDFAKACTTLSRREIGPFEAEQYLIQVFGEPKRSLRDQPNAQGIETVLRLFAGQGKGADLPSSRNTAWGLLNAVTEYLDHHRRARSSDARLDSAWFGQGAGIKQRALETALALAA